MEFMRENAPNRWQAVQTLPDDGSALQRNVMGFVIARYRMLEGIREEDPKLYETKVQQLRAEDALYGLLSDGSTPQDREKVRGELTKTSKRLFELTLAERAQRIERLKQMVEREEQNLASDQKQMDTMVSARVDALITEGQAALRKDMGGSAGGRRDHWRERGPSTRPAGEGGPDGDAPAAPQR